MSATKRIGGYDPGGDGAHGVAELLVEADGRVVHAASNTVQTADAALAFLRAGKDGVATASVGVDTLTEWCLGPAGWRPADAWLRRTYPAVANSVASPNSLFGAMGLNGMGTLVALRMAASELVVSETHPKVLFFALAKQKYDWKSSSMKMTAWLIDLLGIPVTPKSDHEFDALISAWACVQGMVGSWPRDLHQPIAGVPSGGRMIRPVGITNYFWP